MIKVLEKNPVKDILEKCKINKKEESVKFTELGRDMYKDNPVILNKYFKNESGQDCYYANLLYFRQFNNIALDIIKATLKRDFGQKISLAGYKYNPEHYKFASCQAQEEYEEDLFKNKSKEEEQEELKALRKERIEPLDFEAVKSLYIVLFKALQARLVMILNLESIPALINNALDCYNLGVNCGPSNLAMRTKILEIKELLENKEVIEWLKTKPTDMSFDSYDYISTYQKVLRQLTEIRDNSLEYCRDLLENPEDLWIEDIISNDIPDEEQLYESDSDENEFLENNELFD